MSQLEDAVQYLRRALEALEPHEFKRAVAPEEWKFYRTFNGSIVFVAKIDDDGDGVVVVLKGGHGVEKASGEEPGERYYVDSDGYYKSTEPGIVTTMSLMEEVDIHLPAHVENDDDTDTDTDNK